MVIQTRAGQVTILSKYLKTKQILSANNYNYQANSSGQTSLLVIGASLLNIFCATISESVALSA